MSNLVTRMQTSIKKIDGVTVVGWVIVVSIVGTMVVSLVRSV